MEKMTCPVCGREFDSMYYKTLPNGNPACPECADKEEDKEKMAETDNQNCSECSTTENN